jgi:hypothetical protein
LAWPRLGFSALASAFFAAFDAAACAAGELFAAVVVVTPGLPGVPGVVVVPTVVVVPAVVVVADVVVVAAVVVAAAVVVPAGAEHVGLTIVS